MERPDRALEYCTYCPKMCRFACPVSTVEGRETVTPWGKQTILHEVARGTVPLDEASARPMWACLECHGCRTYCDHRIDVPGSLRRGREAALRAGVAPAAVPGLRDGFAERERRAAAATAGMAAARAVSSDTRLALFPGCTACIERPASVRTALRVLDAASGGTAALVPGYCCGLPLLQAGDTAGFEKAAGRVARALSGVPEVVVPDPGCLHAMKVLYPERGIEVAARLVHLSEWVLPSMGRFRRLQLPGPAWYHDPCHLGRDLGVYDAPRDVLSRLLTSALLEFPRNREGASCCGGGGGLPVTSPDTAREVARQRLSEPGRFVKGSTVVTACPMCRKTFADAGTEWIVRDLVELLGEALL